MPQTLRDATIAIEDRNFFHHGALDYTGIARAPGRTSSPAASRSQGASTITQQLVRNLYIQNPEQTLKRKLKEAHLAEEEEEAHSKDWILTSYLNTAPYGTVEGETAVGVEAAAQTYFGKPAKELGLNESALIAGLPQAPSEYNPFLDPHAALARRNEVLSAMHEQGYITGAEYRETLHSGLELSPGHKYRVIRDPFLFDLVQQELIDKYGINTVRNGGLKAYTTIDPELQERAQEAVDSCSVCYSEGGPAAALASVDPSNGEIVALASTEGYASESEFNYAWQAKRQPGLLVQDLRADDGDQAGHRPRQHLLRRHLADDARHPRRRHLDGQQRRARRRHDVARRCDLGLGQRHLRPARPRRRTGKRHPDRPRNGDRSATSNRCRPRRSAASRNGVTPLEQADGYATLASGGIHHDPTAIARVEFPNGKVDEPDPEPGDRVLTEGQAYEVTRLLEGVITQGTGAGYTYMGCPAEAGKTGTSEGLSDAWFVGYTPLYSTAVWVGHPQSREETGFGGPTAGPIWRSFMEAAAAGNCPEFAEPSSLPELSGLKSEHTSSAASAPKGRRIRRRNPKKKRRRARAGVRNRRPNRKRRRNRNQRPNRRPRRLRKCRPAVGGGIASPH